MFQDAQRGAIFGSRTMGAGGNVETYDHVTTYSDGMATITESLMVRRSGKYVENLGVEPDIRQDFMTGDNLLNGGAPFVEAFTKALLERIK